MSKSGEGPKEAGGGEEGGTCRRRWSGRGRAEEEASSDP